MALLVLSGASLVGQVLTGLQKENQELLEHGQVTASLAEYVTSGPFLSAMLENWESEFLQMWAYVMAAFALHLINSTREAREQAFQHGQPRPAFRSTWSRRSSADPAH